MGKLNNYFMKPQFVRGVNNIYPISILDYEDFKSLFVTYLILDIPELNNSMKQNGHPKLPYDNLFDYVISLLNVGEDENIKKLNELYLCELFRMTVKNDVTYNRISQCFTIKKDEKVVGYIGADNFKEYRDKVMEMNLIFTPMIAPNKQAQKYIDAELNKGESNESDIETIVALVSVSSNKDISKYSYYRLMADYCILISQMNRNDTVQYKSGGFTSEGGGQLEVPNITERLSILSNPYDRIFSTVKDD